MDMEPPQRRSKRTRSKTSTTPAVEQAAGTSAPATSSASSGPQQQPRARKAAWQPSEKCADAIGKIAALMEGLSPQERGHVAARLSLLYSPKAKKAPTTDPKGTQKPKATKSPWKAEWEKTAEYAAWLAFKNAHFGAKKPQALEPVVAEYKRLQGIAFALREVIKGRLGH